MRVSFEEDKNYKLPLLTIHAENETEGVLLRLWLRLHDHGHVGISVRYPMLSTEQPEEDDDPDTQAQQEK